MSDKVLYQQDGHIVTLTLNDPAKRNPISELDMVDALVDALDRGTIDVAPLLTAAIPAAQLASRTPPVSIMPPMLGILTPEEIRDVVAYLGTLRPKEKRPPK